MLQFNAHAELYPLSYANVARDACKPLSRDATSPICYECDMTLHCSNDMALSLFNAPPTIFALSFLSKEDQHRLRHPGHSRVKRRP